MKIVITVQKNNQNIDKIVAWIVTTIERITGLQFIVEVKQ